MLVCDVVRPSLSLRACLGLSPPPVAWPPSPLGLGGLFLFTLLRVGLICVWLCRLGVGMASGVNNPLKVGRPSKEMVAKRQRELNARQRAYVVWCSTPAAEREIHTQDELCEVLGVSRQAVWKWSKDPRIIEAIRFCTLQNAGSPERIRQILDMVFERALEKKDVRMAEIWMKGTGVMSQFGRSADILDVVDDLEQDSIADLSTDELERIRRLAAAEQSEQLAVELARIELSMDGADPTQGGVVSVG